MKKLRLGTRILFPVFLLLFTGAFAAECAAQYCIGYTEYRIRRPNGKYLTKKRLKNLRFARIDGESRRFKFDNGKARISYMLGNRVRDHMISTSGRVSVTFGPCGQIGDLELVYKGTVMRLQFDVGINNTNFVIDSLPFRAGTFRLASLECENSKPPPRVDNENRGYCRVPATRWRPADDTRSEHE